jgi:DNA invertase Pin-like site-specific DNA recombinase
MNRSPAVLAGRRGSVLVRVSSTQQDTESQIVAIKEFLARHGLVIPEADWYVEEGRSRLERHKSQVLPLFEHAVRDGRYDYVLTFSQNRGGYKHDLEFAEFANFLLDNGVELWDTTTGILNDPADLGTRVLTVVGNAASTHELKEKALHTVRGKVQAAREGLYFGGNVPYGFDVGIFDAAGNEKWRSVIVDSRKVPNTDPRKRKKYSLKTRVRKVHADGREELYDGVWPAYDGSDQPRYVPGLDPARLEVVMKVFSWYADEAWSFTAIARELIRLRVKPYYGDTWQAGQIQQMLRNPVYVGRPTFNKSGGGAKLYEYLGGEYREVPWHRNRPQPKKKKDVADWVSAAESRDGIIDPDTWGRVQARLARHEVRRVPRREQLWLAGLVYCAGCGKPMIATSGSPRHRKRPHFYCQTYKSFMGRNSPTGCGKNNAPAEVIEELVERYLAEAQVTAETLVKAETNPALLRPFLEKYWSESDNFLTAHRRMREFITEALDQGEHQLSISDGRPTLVVVEGDQVQVHDESITTFDVYRHLHDLARVNLIGQIGDLERRRENLYEGMKAYRSDYARQKADAEMEALTLQVEELQASLVRQDLEARQSHRRLLELQAQLADARKALAGNVFRRKAEAVRKVIGGIVCHFRRAEPTSRRNVPGEELFQLDIIPAPGTSLKVQVCDSAVIARAGRRWRAACRSGPPATSPRTPRSACRRPRPCR